MSRHTCTVHSARAEESYFNSNQLTKQNKSYHFSKSLAFLSFPLLFFFTYVSTLSFLSTYLTSSSFSNLVPSPSLTSSPPAILFFHIFSIFHFTPIFFHFCVFLHRPGGRAIMKTCPRCTCPL